MEIVVIAHNIRSIHNVGSIFRTAEGFGVQKIYLSGYTPSPDHGLPHVRVKIARELHKTALGAENMVDFSYQLNVFTLLKQLHTDGFHIIGLEQDPRAIPLPEFNNYLQNNNDNGNHYRFTLLLGEEVNGIALELRDLCDSIVEIPMHGKKESFNVAVAVGIALYYLTTMQSAP